MGREGPELSTCPLVSSSGHASRSLLTSRRSAGDGCDRVDLLLRPSRQELALLEYGAAHRAARARRRIQRCEQRVQLRRPAGVSCLRVPLGWRVVVTCGNAASRRHSCAIVRGPQTVVSAFPGATTTSPTLGLRPGQTARFMFKASRAGSYRIACLVPGHEDARMWDVLVVGGVKRPSISERTGF